MGQKAVLRGVWEEDTITNRRHGAGRRDSLAVDIRGHLLQQQGTTKSCSENIYNQNETSS